MSHTEGDWEVWRTRSGGLKIKCGPKQICSDTSLTAKNNNEYVTEEERESNFALIQAAPKMYRILKRMAYRFGPESNWEVCDIINQVERQKDMPLRYKPI